MVSRETLREIAIQLELIRRVGEHCSYPIDYVGPAEMAEEALGWLPDDLQTEARAFRLEIEEVEAGE